MAGLGSHTFTWSHPGAKEVIVTGTFDNWGKTVQLEKKGDSFEKTVSLPVDQKVLYKFFVDGAWTLDPSKPSETDDHSIANNVLEAKDITPHPVTAAISSVGPGATTAAMAAQTPKDTPGGFPETPAADQTMSVNPIPATAGIGNPVKLAPGEPVPDPSTLTSNTVQSTVKTDPESYKKSDALPGGSGDAAMFTVPPVTKNMIPESSLPMGGTQPFLAGSAAPGSTTADLAGKVPLESAAVPPIVGESIDKAGTSPEAAANPEALVEKKEVESELKAKVPEEPATSTGGYSASGIIAGVTGAATAAGTAAMVAAGSAQEQASDLATTSTTKATGLFSDTTEKLKSMAGMQPSTAPGVPAVVQESINEAHLSPEAAANPEAVQEKSAMEGELKKAIEEKEEKAAEATKAAEAAKKAEEAEKTGAPTGTAEGAEAGPAEPPKESTTPSTPADSKTDKKSKRKSVMMKLKKVFKSDS